MHFLYRAHTFQSPFISILIFRIRFSLSLCLLSVMHTHERFGITFVFNIISFFYVYISCKYFVIDFGYCHSVLSTDTGTEFVLQQAKILISLRTNICCRWLACDIFAMCGRASIWARPKFLILASNISRSSTRKPSHIMYTIRTQSAGGRRCFMFVSFFFPFSFFQFRIFVLRTEYLIWRNFFRALFLFVVFSLLSLCRLAQRVWHENLFVFALCICLCMGELLLLYVYARAYFIFWAFGVFNVKVVALGRMRIRVRQTEIMCYIFVGTYSMLRTKQKRGIFFCDVHSFGCRLWIFIGSSRDKKEHSAVGRKHSKTI